MQTQMMPKGLAKAEPQDLVADGKLIGKRIKTVQGMACWVCNKPVGKDDFSFLVNGQRVAVHRVNCYAELLRRPYHFLEILQPHGAFLGAGAEEPKASFGWFLAGLSILAGLVFAALCAQQALHCGRSPVAWFGWGLVFNVFGYLLLLTCPPRHAEGFARVPAGLGKVHVTPEPSSCPECGKTNHPSAAQCAGCGARLQPSSESEVEKAGF
ncbi:MAG TPA: hypothetical protein VMW54_00315 [Terriglobia bacterium]|nr:hypothetical protein [Terriglobia bacterium]